MEHLDWQWVFNWCVQFEILRDVHAGLPTELLKSATLQTSLTIVTGASTLVQTYVAHWPTPAPTVPPSPVPTPTPSGATVVKVCRPLVTQLGMLHCRLFTVWTMWRFDMTSFLDRLVVLTETSVTGIGWTGPTACESGSTCKQLNSVSC